MSGRGGQPFSCRAVQGRSKRACCCAAEADELSVVAAFKLVYNWEAVLKQQAETVRVSTLLCAAISLCFCWCLLMSHAAECPHCAAAVASAAGAIAVLHVIFCLCCNVLLLLCHILPQHVPVLLLLLSPPLT